MTCGLLKLMLNQFSRVDIILCLDAFGLISFKVFNIVLLLDASELISFKRDMMINVTKLFSLMPL